MITRSLPALLAPFVLALPAAAQITTLGFDGVSAPGAFQQIAPGFANGPHLEYPGVTLDGGVILNDALFDDAATSGANILASCDTCLLGDTPPTGLPGVITGVFDAPVAYVALDLSNGTSQTAQFELLLFDALGSPLGGSATDVGPQGSALDTRHLDFGTSGGDIASFTVGPAGLSGYTFAIDTLRFGDLPGGWGTLGTGLAGVQGVPLLQGDGDLVAESQNTVTLRRGVPDGTAFLVAGASQLDAPFKGGVLIPMPDLLIGPLGLDAVGSTSLTFIWPSGLPPFASVFLQGWIPDPAGPAGWSSSAGLIGSAN